MQDAQEFSKKVNDNGGNFELFVYDDAGHAFLTAEIHRDSKHDVRDKCFSSKNGLQHSVLTHATSVAVASLYW